MSGSLSDEAEVLKLVQDERKATARAFGRWRHCAAQLQQVDGERLAEQDAAKGEWRFATYKHYDFGAYHQVPGFPKCEPSLPKGHDRLKQLSACSEYLGKRSEADCACQAAEFKYRRAYNRVIAARVEDAPARNCLMR